MNFTLNATSLDKGTIITMLQQAIDDLNDSITATTVMATPEHHYSWILRESPPPEPTITDQKSDILEGDSLSLTIGTEEEETEGQNTVTLSTHGMRIHLEYEKPKHALFCYNALLSVQDISIGC